MSLILYNPFMFLISHPHDYEFKYNAVTMLSLYVSLAVKNQFWDQYNHV